MGALSQDVALFFDKMPEALPLYEAFEKRVLEETENVHIRVQKTQISFSNRHNFAFVSFLPVRKAANRPKAYIGVESPRIDVATEPYPNRWTHHVLLASEEEMDDELMAWVKEAAAFAAAKHTSRH